MSSKPTRFENYPREPGAASEVRDDHAHPAPVVRANVSPPAADPRAGRRTLIGFVLTVPIAMFGFSTLGGEDSEVDVEGGAYVDPAAPPGGATATEPRGAESSRELIVGGRYRVSPPEGWSYAADGGGGLVFTNGANQLSASAIDVPPSTLAVEHIAILARSHQGGFDGAVGKPVDRSTAAGQQARMAGTGTFRARTATLLAELWIDDTGSGLLTTRILTSKPGSAVSGQVQAMVDELSADL